MKDILKFCLTNEARKEAEDNFRAEQQRISGSTRRAVLSETIDAVADSNTSDKQVGTLADIVKHGEMFVKSREPETSYDQYARVKGKEKPEAVFTRLREAESNKSGTVATMMKMGALPAISNKFLELKDQVATRPNPPADLSPNFVDSAQGTAGSEVQCEAKSQVEQQSVVENLTEQEQMAEVAVELFIPMVHGGHHSHGDVHPLKADDISNALAGKASRLRPLTGNIPVFDKGIYCSEVFERNLASNPTQPVNPQAVFYTTRKPAKSALIAKVDNQWIMVIPTTHEAHAACKEFVGKQPENALQVAISPVQHLVMHKAGTDRTDNLSFTDPADEDKFYELYVQAKLFNGETDFSSGQEREALKKWLQSKGPQAIAEFKTYFESNILAARPRRFADAYPKSTLKRVLTEVGAAA